MPLTLYRLRDGQASAAWAAYIANKAGFPAEERDAATRVPTPKLVLLLAPQQQPVDSSSRSTRVSSAAFNSGDVDAAEVGSNAIALFAVAAATVSGTHVSRKLLFMHSRKVGRGKGHVDRLIASLQAEMPENGVLIASFPACQTWFATLVFLRNDFACSHDLFTSDVPFPGEHVSGDSGRFDFVWRRDTGNLRERAQRQQEHIAFVRAAARKQRRRRSTRATEFADALDGVAERLEARAMAAATAAPAAAAVAHLPAAATPPAAAATRATPTTAVPAARAACAPMRRPVAAIRGAIWPSSSSALGIFGKAAAAAAAAAAAGRRWPGPEEREETGDARSQWPPPTPTKTTPTKATAERERELPQGWMCEWKDAPAKRYKAFSGPDGATSKSLKGAWRVYNGEASAQHDRVGGRPLSVKRKKTNAATTHDAAERAERAERAA